MQVFGNKFPTPMRALRVSILQCFCPTFFNVAALYRRIGTLHATRERQVLSLYLLLFKDVISKLQTAALKY